MQWINAVLELIPIKELKDPDIVTLEVGVEDKVESFFLHKTLLQLSSISLKTLLLQNENSYKLPGVRPSIFEEIVKHVYTFSEWEFNGNLVEACRLLKAALDFDLQELAHTIHKTISKLTLENVGLTCETASFVYDVVRTTSFVDEGKLKHVLLSYICKNAKIILAVDSFLNLSLDGILEILRKDDLQVDSELDVFKAVISWGINTSEKNLKCSSLENLQDILREPLKYIRFPNMSTFEIQYYVQQMGFPPAKQETLTEVFNDEEVCSEEYIRFLFISAKKSSLSSEASAEIPRKYSQSPGICKSDLQPSMVDILQAELYVSNFKFQVETSVLKSKLSELNEQTRRALDSQQSSQNKVEEMVAEIEDLKEEISKVRFEAEEAKIRVADFEKNSAESENIVVLGLLGGEWRSFIRDSVDLSSGRDAVVVVIQNNTALTLEFLCSEGISGYCEMPESIAAFAQDQFSFQKRLVRDSIVLFSYSASLYNCLIIGVRTDSVDDFAVGYDCPLEEDSLNFDVYTKLRSEFWKDHDDNASKTGIVATRKFQPYKSPATHIRASMSGGVLKILIFQE